MQTIETKKSTSCIISIAAAILLIVAGGALAGYFLGLVPSVDGITLGTLLLYFAAAGLPIVAGCIWIGVLYRRRRRTAGGRNPFAGGLFLGLLLIIAGLLMLSFATGIIPAEWRPVFISWQMLIILLGLAELCRLHLAGGATLVIVGSFFIIPKIIAVSPASWDIASNFTSLYWPLLLVAFGVLIVLSIIIKPHLPRKCYEHGRHFQKGVEEADSKDGKVNYNLIFTGLEQIFLAPEFRGGEISNVCAGMELDLRRTSLPEGTTHLKVSLVLGGLTIYAPSEWNIEIKNDSVLGAFQDKRMRHTGSTDETRCLVIHSSCVLGGGEIK